MERDIHTEQVLEVRHTPIGSFLNIRGTVADRIAANTQLKEWAIGQDRVDFHDSREDDWTERAFVSYRNFGYVAVRPTTKNFFPDKASKFIKEILAIKDFVLPPIIRIGVRSRFVYKFDKEMSTLIKLMINKLNYPEATLKKLFNGEITDLGIPINFESEHGKFNILFGPMDKEQLEAYMVRHDSLPKVGVFFDIDYFKEDLGSISERELTNKIKSFSDDSWDKFENIKALLIG